MRTRRSRRCRRSTSRMASTTTARRSPSATCRSATARSRWLSRGSTTSTSRSSRTRTTTATKPYIDGIDFKIFKDPNTAYTEFEAGNLDFTQIGEGKIKDASSQVRRVARTATPSTRASRSCSAPRTAPTTWSSTSTTRTMQERRPAQGDLPGDQPPGHLRHRSSRARASRPTTSCRRASPATRRAPGRTRSTTSRPPRQALADAGYPEGKGAPEIKLTFNNDGGHEKIMELIQSRPARHRPQGQVR